MLMAPDFLPASGPGAMPLRRKSIRTPSSAIPDVLSRLVNHNFDNWPVLQRRRRVGSVKGGNPPLFSGDQK